MARCCTLDGYYMIPFLYFRYNNWLSTGIIQICSSQSEVDWNVLEESKRPGNVDGAQVIASGCQTSGRRWWAWYRTNAMSTSQRRINALANIYIIIRLFVSNNDDDDVTVHIHA